MEVGKTVKVSVKSVKPKKASKAVTYKSSNKKIATVSKKGVVTGKAPGKVKITVTSKKNKKLKKTVKITVTAAQAAAVQTPAQISDGTQASVPVATSEQMGKVLSGEDTATKLIDARDSDAYAGWALDGATRGGHFEGAMNLDAAWVGNAKFDSIISDNGITSEQSYIVYDVNGKDAIAVADYLMDNGITNIYTYNAVNEINGQAKVEQYKNYGLTVPASVVKDLSDYVVNQTELTDAAKQVVGDSKDVVILECSWGAPEETNYAKNHVPGALHIDTNETDPPAVYVEADGQETLNQEYLLDYKYEWRLNTDENLIKLFSSRGISKDSCVVVTGSSAAPVSRCGILLKYIGVENVHIMSKGYTGWKAAGYEFESENRNAGLPNGPEEISQFDTEKACEIFGVTKATALHPEIYEKTAYVQENLGKDGYQLVDNRSQDEWDGLESNYPYEDLAGRIDGSIHSKQNSYNPDNSMRSKLLQDAKWIGDGIDLDKHITFFCGDGWRAAVDTWNAWVLGYDASIYHGWMEWSNSGCNFINKDGKTVHYDKARQAVVDSKTDEIVQELTTKFQFEQETVNVTAAGDYENLNVLINKTGITPQFSSSNNNLATVDENGAVKVISIPETQTEITIEASVQGFENNYRDAEDRSASYTLVLNPGTE